MASIATAYYYVKPVPVGDANAVSGQLPDGRRSGSFVVSTPGGSVRCGHYDSHWWDSVDL